MQTAHQPSQQRLNRQLEGRLSGAVQHMVCNVKCSTSGRLRLCCQTPNWSECWFVHLLFSLSQLYSAKQNEKKKKRKRERERENGH